MKTHRLLPIFVCIARSVRLHVRTWLLIGWFTVCSTGIPIPDGFALESEKGTSSEVQVDDAPAPVKLSRSLEPTKTTGGCCSTQLKLTNHGCGCSMKKQQSGTCCCSKTISKVTSSCCSNKVAFDQPTASSTKSDDDKDDSDHNRIISVCGCAEEVGGFLFFSKPFEVGDHSPGLKVQDAFDSLIASDLLFESHFLMPESPPPEVV